ncbi:Ulp1 protease family protein [Eremomyces bilateralis CBS 781.70]|uniref:Ulp1 protease family protein n=1 Tax=Eremomyces bilateralis CBS 781.70 TaxID=1392243 RepID=A0A6G1GAW6_9PEZI|nr:Ulp1 protease family protein [Eremomyces bilateralis CBS 781.70]KAF1815076.1 Ulp1 protease family protein [Eremomyces bilateralis CBS 781.70]
MDCIKNDWLTDNAIAFWEEWLEHEELKTYSKAQIVLLRPSMSFMLMTTKHPSTIKDALPQFDKTTHIFLPINDSTNPAISEGGSHWSLLLVSLLDGVAFHYDSLDHSNRREAQTVTSKLQSLLGMQLRFKEMDSCPQQANGSDCGVYVCLIMRHLLLKRLLQADSRARVPMTLSSREINPSYGRKEMLKIIESLRREGEKRRS